MKKAKKKAKEKTSTRNMRISTIEEFDAIHAKLIGKTKKTTWLDFMDIVAEKAKELI